MKDTARQDLEVLGYVERVRIEALDLVIPAKLDTGATTSSINALNQQFFEKNGKEWVRFSLQDPADKAHMHTLEREVVRDVRIKRHGGPSLRRAVVKMTFCFGHQAVKSQVTLADRSKYTYQLLLGRNHMRGVVTIDPGRRYTTEPDCNGKVTLLR